MSGLTGDIERFLKSMLSQTEDGMLEIGRNELAEKFSCAPSQINYVLTTRFSPFKGYTVESRRGGSGYIRIIKLTYDDEDSVKLLIEHSIGQSITIDKAAIALQSLIDEDRITEQEARLMIYAIDNTALSAVSTRDRNRLRADILKNMLLVFLT